MVHFQLTKLCNLRCAFCGQRHEVPPGAMKTGEWIALLRELKDYAPGSTVVLWGGEPLLDPGFESVASAAADLGFPLELVTNGTLIDRHAETLKEKFSRIYISVDGPEEIHDSIRGKGVFGKVKDNLELLRNGNAELVMMSVMTLENMESLSGLPFGLPADRAILHQMIYLTEEECASLPEGNSGIWRKNARDGYEPALASALERLGKVRFEIPVVFQPHFRGGFCREPYRHLHIGSDGETSFCTDFTEDSLGNVREKSLRGIFEGELAETFRSRGNTVYCAHCSWKNTPGSMMYFQRKPTGNST